MSWAILGRPQLESLRKGVVKLERGAGYGRRRSTTPSLRLDAGRLHDRQQPYFLSVAEGLDLGRRGRPGRGAKIGVARFHRGIGERLDGERIYLRHQIGLHVRWPDHG